MSDSPAEQLPAVPWIASLPKPPLCDVPWFGNLVVLSSGDVNFCCFSPVVIGNVNEASFEEIWNGATMRRIRRTLAHQKMPPECRTISCPIHRGDKNHFIRGRVVGMYSEEFSGQSDPHESVRAGFKNTGFEAAHGSPLPGLRLAYDGPAVFADLYVSIRNAAGVIRFLPTLEETPRPVEVGIALPWAEGERSISLTTDSLLLSPGRYEVCAAFFESGSRPTIVSNCYWAMTMSCEVS